MDVPLNPDLQAKLSRLAAEQGRASESLVVEAVERMVNYEEWFLREVKECLLRDFRIDHTTIQFEHVICEVAHGCVIPVAETEEHHHHSH